MSFEERNASWTGPVREFRQPHSRSSAPRLWRISVEDNAIHTWWGQVGGAIQHAVERMPGVNIGKKNEMSPAAYALDRAKEMCRKKNWEGYREFSGEEALDQIVSKEIDFDNLPLSLCFYKPDNSMGAGITKKAQAGQVWYARKRNGLMYVIARGEGPAKLYSRRMLRGHDDEDGTGITWDRRFPHIIEVANAILPKNSILLGELVMDRDGKDDFKHVQSITKSLTPQSLCDQQAHGLPSFYCWDVAFWEGQELAKSWPVSARYALAHELDGGHVIQPVEFFPAGHFKRIEDAVAHSAMKGWEGFVVVDPEGIYGDRAYNFKGKPDRPGAFCAKLKAEHEDDFIAVWDPEGNCFPEFPGPTGERSTKDRSAQGIASVALYQRNQKGELVYISNVHSGLTDKMKTELARYDAWPRVWRVIYTERAYKSQGDDTNALTFARFSEERSDKTPDECINPEL
jgi:predicted DNA-binding WGR domain protein